MYDVVVCDWIFTRHHLVSYMTPEVREVRRGGFWPFRTTYTQIMDGNRILFEIEKRRYLHMTSTRRVENVF